MSNTIPLPLPGSLGLIQYCGKEMQEIRNLRAQVAKPNCRTCKSFYHWEDGVCKQSNKNPCANGDRYQPLPPVRLWRNDAPPTSA